MDDHANESANHPRNAEILSTKMKLSELNPRWVGYGTIIDGVSFDCPHCKKQRLGITFSPPIDPDGMWPKISQPTYAGVKLWKRTGDTFDTLSLTPSVDAAFDGHWHGFITNGQVS